MTKGHRLLAIAALVVLTGSTLLDPYTWFRDASDLVLPAPVWQTALGLTNAMIVITALVLMWRQHYRPALMVLAFEFSFNVASTLIYLNRDGLQRFSHGFAGEEYLSWYLLLLLIRVWLIAWIAHYRNQQ